jgi:hypothetical protein
MIWTKGIESTLVKTTGKQEKPNMDPEKVKARFVLEELVEMCLSDKFNK